MISTTGRSTSYTPDGVQTIFTFPHAVIDGDHLSVTIDGTATTAFSVTGVSDTGATLTFSTAPTANSTLVISRTTPNTQLVDYVPNEAFNAETHEDALDKLTLLVQELADDLSRAIKAPVGSTTQTRFTTSDYGKYLKLQSDGDIEGAEGTAVTSSLELGDASDVDIISVSAAGTTTITIPDTKTTIFGAAVAALDGAGAYTHNIDLPAPATTGQRAFIRIASVANATNPTIVVRDNAGATLASIAVSHGNYRTDLEVVANGSSWVLGKIKYGDVCHDRFTGAAYFVTDSTGLDTAIADANAHIYLYQKVTFDSVLTTEVHRTLASTNRLIVAKGAGFDFGDQRGWSLTIDCEIEVAYDDQQIFFNCFPGTVTGAFGGMVRSAEWWRGTGEALLGYSDDWWAIQSAIYAGDWDGSSYTASTITNWNDTTDVITTADQVNFSQGDKVELYNATLGAYVSSRPYLCINGTNGSGDNMSTFQLGMFPKHRANVTDQSPLNFGSGGSLSAKVRKVTCAAAHTVKLLSKSGYTIDHPLDFVGTGCHLDLNGATVTASEDPDSSGSAWISKMVENEAFADGAGQAFTKTDYVSGPNTTDISITTHGYIDGDIVGFSALTTAGNLSTADGYIVNQIDANTFRLRSTVGGSDLDLGANVAGTVFLKGGAAPVFLLGSASGESNVWRGIPQKVSNGFVSGGGIAGVSIIGAGGTIPRRSVIEDLSATLASRSFVGWARDWDAVPGQAASNDFSELTIRNCRYHTSQKHGGVWPIPAHTPGIDVKVDGLEIQGNTVASGDVPYIWYGGSPRTLTIEDVEYQDSPIFLKFANHGLYLNATLRGIMEQAGSNSDATSCASVDTGTEIITSTAHPFSNGDRVAFEGTGSLPTGLSASIVYFIITATTNTFQLSETIGGTAVNLTADNGAFTLHKVGTVLSFESSQATAKVFGYDIGTMDDSLLGYHSGQSLFTNGNNNNSLTGNRRTPLLAYGSGGVSEFDVSFAREDVPAGFGYRWIAHNWAGSGNWEDEVGDVVMAPSGGPTKTTDFNGSGLASIDFDNSGDFFTASTGLVRGYAEDNAGDEWCWIVVHSLDTLTSTTALDFLSSGGTDRAMMNGTSGGLWGLERRTGTTDNTRTTPDWTPSTGVAYITMINCSSATSIELRMDGHGVGSQTKIDSSNDPAGDMTDCTSTWIIGTQSGFGTGDYDGKIAEVILYPSALTGAQVTSAFNSLRGKYGIIL